MRLHWSRFITASLTILVTLVVLPIITPWSLNHLLVIHPSSQLSDLIAVKNGLELNKGVFFKSDATIFSATAIYFIFITLSITWPLLYRYSNKKIATAGAITLLLPILLSLIPTWRLGGIYPWGWAFLASFSLWLYLIIYYKILRRWHIKTGTKLVIATSIPLILISYSYNYLFFRIVEAFDIPGLLIPVNLLIPTCLGIIALLATAIYIMKLKQSDTPAPAARKNR